MRSTSEAKLFDFGNWSRDLTGGRLRDVSEDLYMHVLVASGFKWVSVREARETAGENATAVN